MTVAEYLIARLQQAGVDHVFAVPGDYASPFLEALDTASGITRVANINELGCGYAADGYARFRGVGAVCVQYGVGSLSLLNATAGSFVERVPVAVISASPSRADRELERADDILFHHSTGKLRTDQRIFRSVTVASEVITNARTAPTLIDRAMVAMLSHRRPIYIEVLSDVWNLSCSTPGGKLTATVRASDQKSLEAAVANAWERIEAADLPVLWAGVEIQRLGFQDLLQQIVDASGLYFTTTSLGKTVLDESQPHFAGTYAGPASPAATEALMSATDCPIALGTIITDDYLNIMKSSFGQMIEATDEETRVGYQYYHQVYLGDFLKALLDKFRGDNKFPRQYSLPKAPQSERHHAQEDEALSYNSFFEGLTRFLEVEKLKDQSVLVLGESTSLYVFGNLFGLPRNAFVAQAAWGSLGHETGCALGVALGSGKRPFVVAGDGGFMMICQELSSLVRQSCNAVIFVLSNRAYAIEQAFVDLSAFEPGQKFADFDLLPSWDYLALAKAFGAEGYRVKDQRGLGQTLKKVKDVKDRPALVEVIVPQKDLAPQLKRLAETPAQVRKYRRIG